jgi:hypothetical protein
MNIPKSPLLPKEGQGVVSYNLFPFITMGGFLQFPSFPRRGKGWFYYTRGWFSILKISTTNIHIYFF